MVEALEPIVDRRRALHLLPAGQEGPRVVPRDKTHHHVAVEVHLGHLPGNRQGQRKERNPSAPHHPGAGASAEGSMLVDCKGRDGAPSG